MRKFVYLALLIFTMGVYSQNISNVRLSPSKTTYNINDPVRIYWNYSGIHDSENVKITLWKESATQSTCLIADNIPVTAGTSSGYSWTIPANCINPHNGASEDLTTGRVKIRVRWKAHPVFGESPWFTIQRGGSSNNRVWLEPSLSVISAGTNLSIKWEFPGTSSNTLMKITLWKEGASRNSCLIADNVPYSTGANGYLWTVTPQCRNPRTGNMEDLTTTPVRIRVRIKNTATWAESSNFNISAQSFELTSPTANTEVTEGQTLNFSWRYTDSSARFTIILQKTISASNNLNLVCWIKIAENLPATGNFTWTVGSGLRSSCPGLEGEYEIVFSTSPNGTFQWTSPWTIKVHETKSIHISSPTAGSIYCLRDTVPIRWTSRGNIQRVIIEAIGRLSIIKLTPPDGVKNTGRFDWEIGMGTMPGDYEIRVSTPDYRVSDMIDSIQIMRVPELRILFPNKYTKCRVHHSCKVRWFYKGPAGRTINLLFLNQGNAVEERRNLPNTGLYNWVPRWLGKYTIKISTSDGTISNQSDEFEVIQDYPTPRIRVIVDNILYFIGDYLDIKWEKTGAMLPKVKIELIDTTGIKIKTITNDAWNDGDFTWQINDVTEGDYKIKITTIDNKVTGESRTFNVLKPSLKLNMTWSHGRKGAYGIIRFTYRGSKPVDVKLELKKNGQRVLLIHPGIRITSSGTKTYSWHIPDYIQAGEYQLVASTRSGLSDSVTITISD